MLTDLISFSENTLTLQRNEYLSVSGTIDTNIYFVKSGSLRIFVCNDKDEDQIIRFGYTNNLVVSLDYYLTGKPSVFSIQALKKTDLRVITKKQLQDYLNRDHHSMIWNNILENLVLQQMERELDLLTSSPEERYQRVLTRSPQLFQEIPHRYIANYLRMSAETLSRLQKH